MSSAVTFQGSFRYESAKLVKQALKSLREILADADEDLPDPLESEEVVDDGLEIKVAIDTTCSTSAAQVYESIVESLAALASSGSVTGSIDESDPTTYNAGDES